MCVRTRVSPLNVFIIIIYVYNGTNVRIPYARPSHTPHISKPIDDNLYFETFTNSTMCFGFDDKSVKLKCKINLYVDMLQLHIQRLRALCKFFEFEKKQKRKRSRTIARNIIRSKLFAWCGDETNALNRLVMWLYKRHPATTNWMKLVTVPVPAKFLSSSHPNC